MTIKNLCTLLFAITVNSNASAQGSKSLTTLFINAKQMPCNNGNATQLCYLTKTKLNAKEWQLFSSPINNFNYQPGYLYKILVKTENITNPPADASNLKYTCMKILKQTTVTKGLPISNQWIISQFHKPNGQPTTALKIANITINQTEKTFFGNGGCNNIGGEVIISGNKIKFNKTRITLMACDYLKEEAQFVAALKEVTNFKIIGCELFLYKGKTKILTLESCR